MTDTTFHVVKPYASARGLARAAMVLLWVFGLVSIPQVGLSLSNIRIFQVLQSVSASLAATEPEKPALEIVFVVSRGMQAVLGVGDQFSRPIMVIGLVAAVVCFIWIYRAHENLPALGTMNPKIALEWAVGWWFIPIWHLFRPYQVVREIWDASDPGVSGQDELGVGSASALLGWWWAMVAFGFVLVFYYPFWAKVTAGTIFGVTSVVDPEFYLVKAISAALSIGAAVLSIFVIFSIDRMQTEKHQRITAGGAPPESA